MVDYNIVLYNTVRNKITSNNIKLFIDISNKLSDSKIPIYLKANDLHTYLSSIGVNIMSINLSMNLDITDKINYVYNNVAFDKLEALQKKALYEKVTNLIISYIIQNNTYNIDTTKLYTTQLEDPNNTKKFFLELGLTIANRDLVSIALYSLNYVPTLYEELTKKEGFDELAIPVNIYNTITDEKNYNAAFVLIITLIYNDIYASTNDTELYNTINTELNAYMVNINDPKISMDFSDKNPYILNAFKKHKLEIKQSEKMPVPSSVETVDGFLSAFESSANVDKVSNKITYDIFKNWNIKLINILNDIIIFQYNILPFYTALLDITNDTELLNFCTTYLTDANITLPTDSGTLLIDILKQAKLSNKNDIYKFSENVTSEYIKEGIIFTDALHQRYKKEIQLIIINIVNTTNTTKQETNNIMLILSAPVYIDASKKNTINFASLLSALGSDKNILLLKKMNPVNFGAAQLDISTMLEGILYDIRKILEKTQNTGKINENCTDEFFKCIKEIKDSLFTDILKINDFGKNTKIWENELTGDVAINTLYIAFSGVTVVNEYLMILYTTLIPGAYI